MTTILYHLTPAGGPAGDESLTSYISRLAKAHSLTVGSLVNDIVSQSIDKDFQIRNVYKDGFEINGMGQVANGFAQAVGKLTGFECLSSLTLLSWQNLFPIRGILRHQKAWCPLCFQEWAEHKQAIYEPLLWNIQAVSICAHHKITLSTKCSHCLKEMPIISRKSRIGYCCNCGNWLGEKNITVERTGSYESEFDVYNTSNIGFLLKYSNITPDANHKNMHGQIRSLITRLGGIGSAARKLGIPKATISAMYEGQNKSSLNTLLRIGFRLGFNLEDIFEPSNIEVLSQVELTNSEPQKSRLNRDWNLIAERLKSSLNDDNGHSSVREIARRIGCDKRLLYYHHPELCKDISNKYLGHLKAQKQHRIQAECKKIKETTRFLFESGVYPSSRKVEFALSSERIILREKAYQLAWKHALAELYSPNEGQGNE